MPTGEGIKKYTRIKHSVLMDIFAKGLLSKREMQVAIVIIRESWGWDKGASNWTKKKLTNVDFVRKTQLKKSHISSLLQRMILENKILVNEENFYSFNEHPDTWKKLPKGELLKPKKVTKKVTPSYQKGNLELLKRELLVTKKVTFGSSPVPVSDISLKDLRGHIKAPKESIKEIFKEIIKESTNFLKIYYKEKINPKGLKTFSDTRKGMVKCRLENFSLNDLKRVIENVSKSKWHMENKQNHFELLFRSDAQVEKYLNLKPKEKYGGIKAWLENGKQR